MVDGRLALAIVLIRTFFLAENERRGCLGIDVATLLDEDRAVFALVLGIEA
jgi:hypothetical protein